MKRIYGNEKTHLTLTEKADQIYSNTDFLRIVEEEYEDDNGEKYGWGRVLDYIGVDWR